MDPITIIGTASSVASIVEVIAKTIGSLRALHDRWNGADLTILNLISQLSALRAALNKISEWITSDLSSNPQHHQLVIDLEDSVACCSMLIKFMDTQLSKLDWTAESTLDLGSRIRVVFEDKGSKEFQINIQRQTSALTLLLAACSYKTTSEQKTLLEKRTTREVFDQVKDYSSSLYVLRDTASCFSGLTNSTGNSSKMSTVFLFDAELMGSAVYQRAVRSLFRRTVRGRGRDVDSVKLYSTTRSMTQWKKDGAARSRNIDALLKDDARRAQKDVNVLLLSGFESGQEIIMRDIQASNPPNYTISELKCFRTKVLDTLIDTISTILEYLKEESEIWGQIDQKHAETVFKQNTPSEEISLELEIAIASLWEGRAVFLGIVESIEVPETIMYRAFYFLEDIHRIAKPDYVPTVHDVLHLPLELRGIREAGFALGARRVRIFDCGGQRSERRKWIHQFEDVGAIIFVANIGSYDEAFVGQNALENTIMWFELSIRTFGSGKAPIILLLNKVRQFEEKLPGSPLSQHFPDYVGSDDPNSARKYILERFNKVNRWRLRICPYFVELGSTSTTELISSVVADALFSNVPNNFDRELNRQ